MRSKAWVQIAAVTLSGNSLRQTVHTDRASVHQAAKLVAVLLRIARVTAGLAECNGSLHHMRAVCQEPGSALEPYTRQLSMGCLLCLLLFACRALCVFNKPGGSSGGSELVQKWVDSIEPLETGSVGHDSGSLGHVILSPSSCLLACHYGCKFYGNLILGENFRQFSEISLNILRWGFVQS